MTGPAAVLGRTLRGALRSPVGCGYHVPVLVSRVKCTPALKKGAGALDTGPEAVRMGKQGRRAALLHTGAGAVPRKERTMLYDINGLTDAEFTRLMATMRIFVNTAESAKDHESAKIAFNLLQVLQKKTCLRPEE